MIPTKRRYSLAVLGLSVLGLLLLGANSASAAPGTALGPDGRPYRHKCPPGTEAFGAAPPVSTKLWCRQPQYDGSYIRQGNYASFNINGTKQTEGNFESNKPHGKWVSYDRAGNKTAETYYYDGKSYKKIRYDQDGNPLPEKNKAQVQKTRKSLYDWSGKKSRGR